MSELKTRSKDLCLLEETALGWFCWLGLADLRASQLVEPHTRKRTARVHPVFVFLLVLLLPVFVPFLSGKIDLCQARVAHVRTDSALCCVARHACPAVCLPPEGTAVLSAREEHRWAACESKRRSVLGSWGRTTRDAVRNKEW